MEILQYAFFQNALLGILLISIAGAIIGTYIVTRRMVFITGGITHASFGGLGVGYYLGISPTLSALGFAILSALGVEWLSKGRTVREDSAIAVFWALGMAVGIVFIFMTPGYAPGLTEFLFGNILTITRTDLWLFGGFALVLTLFFIGFYHYIVFTAFDRDFAYTQGVPVQFINYCMILFVSVCVVLTIRLVGIMLLMSLLTLPQMVAELYSNRFRTMVYLSVVIGIICGTSGLLLACIADVPAGATIVLTQIFIYAVAKSLSVARHRLPGKSRGE